MHLSSQISKVKSTPPSLSFHLVFGGLHGTSGIVEQPWSREWSHLPELTPFPETLFLGILIKDILRTLEESYRMLSPSSLGIWHHSLGEKKKEKTAANEPSVRSRAGQDWEGTGESLPFFFVSASDLCSFLPLLPRFLSIYVFSCCFFSLFYTEVGLDEHASGRGHDRPLHFHADGSNPDSSGH